MINILLVAYATIGLIIWLFWYGVEERKWSFKTLIEDIRRDGFSSFYLLIQLILFWFPLIAYAIYKKRKKK
jgi:hypothetical protein